MADARAESRLSRSGTSLHALSLARCALYVTGLAIVTAGLVFDYSGEEPLWRFRVRDVLLYLGLGSLSFAGWCALVVVLGGKLLREPKSIATACLLAMSVLGTWIGTWSPHAYVQDLGRGFRVDR